MKFRKAAILLLVLFTSVACDQVTKIGARKYLEGEGTTSYLGDTFRLTYIENHGAFLGLGSSLPEFWRTMIFVVFVTAMLIGVVVWTIRTPKVSTLALVSLSLVVGGGVGNLIDRVLFDGGVTDFLNIGIGSLRTGIFNVADVWIMLGAGLLFLARDFREPKEASETS